MWFILVYIKSGKVKSRDGICLIYRIYFVDLANFTG